MTESRPGDRDKVQAIETMLARAGCFGPTGEMFTVDAVKRLIEELARVTAERDKLRRRLWVHEPSEGQ